MRPKSQNRRARRYMFMTDEIATAIDSPAPGDEKRFDELFADLVSFLFARTIHPDYLWQLSPPNLGVWEIRSHIDDPQIRVFGQFARKNVFIAMTMRYRSELGDIHDTNWTYEIRRARHCWQTLFPGGFSALITTDPHKAFSGAVNEKYFKD